MHVARSVVSYEVIRRIYWEFYLSALSASSERKMLKGRFFVQRKRGENHIAENLCGRNKSECGYERLFWLVLALLIITNLGWSAFYSQFMIWNYQEEYHDYRLPVQLQQSAPRRLENPGSTATSSEVDLVVELGNTVKQASFAFQREWDKLFTQRPETLSRGFIYFADKSCRNDFCKSLCYLRALHPNASVALVTDDEEFTLNECSRGIHTGRIDHLIRVDKDTHPEQQSPLKRLLFITKTPFDLTVMLDADTLVAGDLYPLFDMLQWYDVAMATDPFPELALQMMGTSMDRYPEVQYNWGVMAYRKTPAAHVFFQMWLEYYTRFSNNNAGTSSIPFLGCQNGWDQCGALSEAIRRSPARIATLRNEWNIFFIALLQAKGRVFHKTADPAIQHANDDSVKDKIRLYERYSWRDARIRWERPIGEIPTAMYGKPFVGPNASAEWKDEFFYFHD